MDIHPAESPKMTALPQLVKQLVKDIVAKVNYQREHYIMRSNPYFPFLNNDSMFFNDLMSCLPDIDDDRTVDLVLDICLQSGLQSCACEVAVRYDRVEELLRSAPSCVPELDEYFWNEALAYMANKNRWSSIQTLLSRGTGWVCWSHLGCEAVWAFQDHPAAVEVFDMLSAQCLELGCECRREYVSTVTGMGMVDRFKMLINSKNASIRQLVQSESDLAVYTISARREFPAQRPGSDLNGCLSAACEAGLFTTGTCTTGQSSIVSSMPQTAMAWAVYFNQPDMVCFLYHAGATNNSDLYQLSRHADLEAKAKADPANVPQLPGHNKDYPAFHDVDAAKSIQSFLSRKASTPRSLKSLCLLQVSGHLGWGHGRESRIQQLKIPYTLKQDLQFRDQKVLLKYPSKE